MGNSHDRIVWHKVAECDELAEARVKSVTAGTKSIALTHFNGQYAAMDNHCPHQGGPLGEGAIERGSDGQCWLRCPWHGWDFDPLTGKPPGGHKDSGQDMYLVETRDDGIYVGITAEPEHARTTSDVIADTLVNWGVTSVFGMVGHSNLGLADALRRQHSTGKLNYYGIRHEGAAAFAVSAYGKLTGTCAAALTIAGPGATNLMTGLWDAKVDRAPALALTGQVQEQVVGVHAFQDIDLEAAFQPVAAFSQTIHPDSDHAALAGQAVKTALVEGDVSHLVFPDNVQTLPVSERARAGYPAGRMASRKFRPDESDLEAAFQLIAAAKRPLIIVGYGALESMDQVVALAERLNAPIATTFKAKGQIPDAHPLAAGVLGRSGTPIASWFMNEADLQIVLGASFSDHTGIYPSASTVQIDTDPMRIGKRHPVTAPVLGDVGLSVGLITDKLADEASTRVNQRDDIAGRWAIWRAEKSRRILEDNGKGISAAALMDVLTRHAPDEAILPVDVGNNTYSFGRYFEAGPDQRVLMSGYLGSIGFALPAAMGAWAATQDREAYKGRKIISLSGDGGLGQYAMELTTLAKYQMNICHIVMNNAQLGKITKEQRAGEFDVWETDLVNPSFCGLARLCGIHGAYVKSRDELEAVIVKAIMIDGPALVEVFTDAELV
jgi:pyruvate oxidase